VIPRLDHVAVAVRDIEHALVLYRDMLGGRICQAAAGDLEHFPFAIVQIDFPNGVRVELICPIGGKPDWLVQFLEQRGEGMHHITFISDNLERDTERVREAGFRVVGENYDDPRWSESFISPRSASGVLVQLASSTLTLEEQDAWFMRPGGLESVLDAVRPAS
jgi:methylmalonyl-CoA/ethylmalonyl-CoA epimerase